jgi:hypothetical protein
MMNIRTLMLLGSLKEKVEWHTENTIPVIHASVADPDPGSVDFLPPGSGMNFWRILDPAPFLVKIFLHSLPNPCYGFLMKLLKLTPETISCKKKVCLVLLPPFYIGPRIRDPRSGMKNSRIRDKTSRICNTDTCYASWFGVKISFF